LHAVSGRRADGRDIDAALDALGATLSRFVRRAAGLRDMLMARAARRPHDLPAAQSRGELEVEP